MGKLISKMLAVMIACLFIIISPNCKNHLFEDKGSVKSESSLGSNVKTPNTEPGKLSYDELISQIDQDRKWFHQVYLERQDPQILDSAGKYILDALVNKLFPYWYGTPWDFNGHTNVPNEGEVACGYFVSTTLKHIGFNLNRYKMAQQSALNEIKSLGSDYRKYVLAGSNDILRQVNEELDMGIYVVGLDFHVGFLLKTHEKLFFIHSNYLFPREVIIEEAMTSIALKSSQSIYLGNINQNKELLNKWISGAKIEIMMDD